MKIKQGFIGSLFMSMLFGFFVLLPFASIMASGGWILDSASEYGVSVQRRKQNYDTQAFMTQRNFDSEYFETQRNLDTQNGITQRNLDTQNGLSFREMIKSYTKIEIESIQQETQLRQSPVNRTFDLLELFDPSVFFSALGLMVALLFIYILFSD